jgi:putative transposase
MDVPKGPYQIRAYKIKHCHDISNFLEAYRLLLQGAMDEIWKNIQWAEKRNKRNRKRIIPVILKSNEFKLSLRNSLLMNWCYSKYYVDSAIKQAYSIIKSWRRSYVRGERRRKRPVRRDSSG